MKYEPNPCEPTCTGRHGGCHGSCTMYKRFRAYRDFINQQRLKANSVNYDIAQIHKTGMRNRHKKRDREKGVSVCPKD